MTSYTSKYVRGLQPLSSPPVPAYLSKLWLGLHIVPELGNHFN